jgi:hypothetical protein
MHRTEPPGRFTRADEPVLDRATIERARRERPGRGARRDSRHQPQALIALENSVSKVGPKA